MKTKGILINDVARRCNISVDLFQALVEQGRLPSSDMLLRTREGYSENLAKQCVSNFKKIGPLIRISHLADKSKNYTSYLRKLIKEERLPAPHIEVYASRYYTTPQLKSLISTIKACKIEDAVVSHKKRSKATKETANARYARRRKMGYFSASDVAKMAKVNIITIWDHQGKENIPTPTKEVKGFFGHYYTKAQAQNIIKFFEQRKRAYESRTTKN